MPCIQAFCFASLLHPPDGSCIAVRWGVFHLESIRGRGSKVERVIRCVVNWTRFVCTIDRTGTLMAGQQEVKEMVLDLVEYMLGSSCS
jgi:hypothetical protein